MSPFENDDPQVTAYVFDELDSAQRIDFEKKLADSAALRACVAETRRLVALLGAAAASSPGEQTARGDGENAEGKRNVEGDALTAEQHRQLDAHLANGAPPTPRRGERPLARGWGRWAVAAGVLLAGGAVFLAPQVSDRMGASFQLSRSLEEAEDAEDSRDMATSAPASRPQVEFGAMSDESLKKALAYRTKVGESIAESIADRWAGPHASQPASSEAVIELSRQPIEAPPGALAVARGVSDADADAEGGAVDNSAGDMHEALVENPFVAPIGESVRSTFSIDVDTASYSKVRMYLMDRGRLPRPEAVRIEELINYFHYDYSGPADDHPFAVHVEVAECPWQPAHRLLRVALQGREIQRERLRSNLVFLIDVSGSMKQPNKLPLLKRAMKLLVEQLTENDQVAIVVYAGAAGAVLDATAGDRKAEILAALERLEAGGATNGGAGIELAYQIALDHQIPEGVNRVILCSDGDFNVGPTRNFDLVKAVEEKARSGVELSVLGFGMGNHNDAMMEQISNRGNGNYAFIDNDREARKVLVEQMDSTLVTIARNVKIQVEFEPQQVAGYRLIGYENRRLANRDFEDDEKDAGEIGAGHSVTAIYEVALKNAAAEGAAAEGAAAEGAAAEGRRLAMVRLRYLPPERDSAPQQDAPRGDALEIDLGGESSARGSRLIETPALDPGRRFGQASRDFRFASSVAAFGMLLRNSEHRGEANWASVLELAMEAAARPGEAPEPYRAEFLEMVRRAADLSR